MSSVPKTEAELERETRAKIDRLNAIRAEHAKSKGISPHDVRLAPEDFDAPGPSPGEPPREEPAWSSEPGSRSARILEAARRLDGEGRLTRASLMAAMGAADPAAQNRVDNLLSSLRRKGAFPYAFRKGGPRTKAKAAPEPQPELSALKRFVNGGQAPPAPRPRAAPAAVAPEPEPEPGPAPAESPDPDGLARLAVTLARLGAAERRFALALLIGLESP